MTSPRSATSAAAVDNPTFRLPLTCSARARRSSCCRRFSKRSSSDGHRIVGRSPFLRHITLQGIGPKANCGKRIAHLMGRIGHQAALTVQRCAHHLCHGVEGRGEMAEFRWPGHVGGWPGDALGHLGNSALQPVERPQHPPRQRASDHRRQQQERQTPGADPQPAPRDIACGRASVDRQHGCADQFTVASRLRRLPGVGGRPTAEFDSMARPVRRPVRDLRLSAPRASKGRVRGRPGCGRLRRRRVGLRRKRCSTGRRGAAEGRPAWLRHR